MSQLLGQGRYYVKVINDCEKPTLHREAEGPALDDAMLLAEAGRLSTFIFEILSLDSPPLIHFAQTPITWNHGEPSGLHPLENDGTTLTLKITPGEITICQESPFELCFDNGAVLWSASGVGPLDPTIIEKPPE